jgi:probable O-glycosylation ligase (exosortase A-associated)
MRDYLLLVFVLGLVPFILWRSWIGAIAWTWVGLMNPHLYAWTLNRFPFAQVIGLAFFVSWLISRDKRMVPMTPGVVILCLLFAFIALKTPFAFYPDVAWDMLGRFAKIVLVALLIPTVIYSPKRVRWMLWTILFSIGVFYGARGGVFAIATGGGSQVQGPEPSFIGGNTHLGVALLMVVPLFVAFMQDTESRWLKRGAIACFWLTMLAIVFTYSRGALLGLAMVGTLLFFNSKRKLLIAAVLIPVGLAALAFTPDKLVDRASTITTDAEVMDTSALARLQSWSVATNIALRHPLGAGYVVDAMPFDEWIQYSDIEHPGLFKVQAAHSIYFQMLGDHGFIGLGLFLFMILATFLTLRSVRQECRRDPDPDREWLAKYALALQIGLSGYLVSGAFVSLAGFDLLYTYVVLSAILFRESRESAAQKKQRAMPVARGVDMHGGRSGAKSQVGSEARLEISARAARKPGSLNR